MKTKKLLLTTLFVLSMAPGVFAMSYKEAKTQSKPVVLYLYMKQCGACKGFSPLFESVSSKFSSKFNFVKELLEDSELASKLNPTSVPSVYIVEPKTNKTKAISYECASDKACFEGTLGNY